MAGVEIQEPYNSGKKWLEYYHRDYSSPIRVERGIRLFKQPTINQNKLFRTNYSITYRTAYNFLFIRCIITCKGLYFHCRAQLRL